MEKKLGDVANRLLFENERVKVWQMDLAPGESSDFHEHKLPYVLCIAEGETVDADFENGKSMRIPVKPGRSTTSSPVAADRREPQPRGFSSS
jgi:hypothetical protein